MSWKLWTYGLVQYLVTALLLVDQPSDIETRVWTARAVDYGVYVVLLTLLYRQFKRSTGAVTTRRMVQFGSYSSAILSLKYVGSWFYMEKTKICAGAIGAACLYALWYFVHIGLVSLL